MATLQEPQAWKINGVRTGHSGCAYRFDTSDSACTGRISEPNTLDTACTSSILGSSSTLDTACTSSILGFDTLEYRCS